jgi:hypothetical protein
MLTKSMVNSLPLVPKVSACAESWVLKVNVANKTATTKDALWTFTAKN